MVHRFASNVSRAICAFAVHFILATVALADTTLAPGDRVSFVVIGSREFDTAATIDSDGSVNLPFIGMIAASGRTVDELRQDIADALSQIPINMQGAEEQPVWKKIEPSNVFVSIVEYRPVYVAGNVRNGGAHPFRPGMTARQALVVAGGIGQTIEEAGGNDLAKVLSERRLLDKRLTLARSEVSRIQTELAELGSGQFPEFAGETSAGRPKQSFAGEQWIAARSELRALNATSNALALKQMQERLSVLEQLEDVSEETLKTYEEEYERLQALAERGVATVNSVTEAQRGLLSFSTRTLEATSEAHKVRTDIIRLKELSEAAETKEREESLRALLQNLAKVKEIKAQISALEFRLSLMGETGREPEDFTTKVLIYRKSLDGEKRIDATLDTQIAPGDVVEFRAVSPSSTAIGVSD